MFSLLFLGHIYHRKHYNPIASQSNYRSFELLAYENGHKKESSADGSFKFKQCEKLPFK